MNWFKIGEQMPRELKCCLCGRFKWTESINEDKAHPSCEEYVKECVIVKKQEK